MYFFLVDIQYCCCCLMTDNSLGNVCTVCLPLSGFVCPWLWCSYVKTVVNNTEDANDPVDSDGKYLWAQILWFQKILCFNTLHYKGNGVLWYNVVHQSFFVCLITWSSLHFSDPFSVICLPYCYIIPYKTETTNDRTLKPYMWIELHWLFMQIMLFWCFSVSLVAMTRVLKKNNLSVLLLS